MIAILRNYRTLHRNFKHKNLIEIYKILSSWNRFFQCAPAWKLYLLNMPGEFCNLMARLTHSCVLLSFHPEKF